MPEKYLEKLNEIVDFYRPNHSSTNQTFMFVGQLLGAYRKNKWPYTASYLHQIINGKLKAGRPLIKAIEQCHTDSLYRKKGVNTND